MTTKTIYIKQQLPKYESDIVTGRKTKIEVAKILGCSVPTLNKVMYQVITSGSPTISSAAFEYEFKKYEQRLVNNEILINDVAKLIGCSFGRVRDRLKPHERVEVINEIPKPIMCTANKLISMRWQVV